MKKPRAIESLEDFYALLQKGPVSGVLLLGGPLRSSHEFSLENNRIVDDSMVDGSQTRYSKTQFERSLYAKAIEQGRLWAE
jgi:hypothetical protein